MNIRSKWLCLTMTAGALAFLGSAPSLLAQEGRGDAGNRLERLERQIHQLAEQQQQFQRQVGAALEQRGPGSGSSPGMNRPPGPPSTQGRGPGPGFGAEGHRPQGPPSAQCQGPTCGSHYRGHRICRLFCVIATFVLVINILLAVWVFTDIRKRGEGHGIFIALALIAGIPGAILYALVRIGDKKT